MDGGRQNILTRFLRLAPFFIELAVFHAETNPFNLIEPVCPANTVVLCIAILNFLPRSVLVQESIRR